MTGVITVIAPRTFFRTFLTAAKLWLTMSSGYISIAVMYGLITFAFTMSGPLWLAALSGLEWVAVMLPVVFALQAWRTLHTAKELGVPVFTFDEEGAECAHGEVVIRLPWSAVHRLSFDAKTCLVYVSKRGAWFFARDLLGKDQEVALCDLARRSNVRLDGRDLPGSIPRKAL